MCRTSRIVCAIHPCEATLFYCGPRFTVTTIVLLFAFITAAHCTPGVPDGDTSPPSTRIAEGNQPNIQRDLDQTSNHVTTRRVSAQASRRSVAPSSVNATANVRVCWALHPWLLQYAAVQHFALTEAAAAGRFPHLTLSYVMVGSNATGPLSTQIAVGLIPRLGQCTVMLGPGWSSIARSIHPLVDAPLWVAASETSTELSNLVAFPHFNRVIPSDEGPSVSIVQLLQHFRWTTVNAFCSESSYGRSFISGFGKFALKAGISIDLQRCFLETATDAEIDSYLVALRDTSLSRVVVAVLDSDLGVRVVPRVKALGLESTLTFIFSENACSGNEVFWTHLPGAFCATFALNETKRRDFEQRYWARTDRAEVQQKFLDVNVFATDRYKMPVQQQPVQPYHAFYVDASLFAMTVFENYFASLAANHSGSIPDKARTERPDRDTILSEWARNRRTTLPNGITGTVQLDRSGDRSSFRATVLNIAPNVTAASDDAPGIARVFATITEDGAVAQAALPVFPSTGESSTVPSHLSPKALSAQIAEADETVMRVLIIVLVVVALLFIAAVAARGVVWWRRRQRLARIPQDPSSPFAVMFVSVANAGALREAHGPAVAAAICRMVEVLVDESAASSACHVARRLDAHFLIVAADAQSTLYCVKSIKDKATAADWESSVAKVLRSGTQNPSHVDAQYRRGAQQRSRGATGIPELRSDHSSVVSRRTAQRHGAAADAAPSTATTGDTLSTAARHRDQGSASASGHSSRPQSLASPPALKDHERSASGPQGVPAKRNGSILSSPSSVARGVTASLSIGVAYGVGTIEPPADESRDPYDFRFSGAVVDDAAHLTDLALAGQVLAAAAVAMAVRQQRSRFGDGAPTHAADTTSPSGSQWPSGFHPFAEIVLPSAEGVDWRRGRRERRSGSDATPVPILQYAAPGHALAEPPLSPGSPFGLVEFDAELPDNESLVHSARGASSTSRVGGAAKVGSLAAALEEASGRLASRPIAVAAILVPELFQRSTPLPVALDIYSAVQSAVACDNVHMLSAQDGLIIIAANAVGPPLSSAPSHVARAARAAVDAVFEESGFVCGAGVDCGVAGVGAIASPSGGSAVQAVSCSMITQRATTLAFMALRARAGASLLDVAWAALRSMQRDGNCDSAVTRSDQTTRTGGALPVIEQATDSPSARPSSARKSQCFSVAEGQPSSALAMPGEGSQAPQPPWDHPPCHNSGSMLRSASIALLTPVAEENESGVVYCSPAAVHELSLHFAVCAVDICAFRAVDVTVLPPLVGGPSASDKTNCVRRQKTTRSASTKEAVRTGVQSPSHSPSPRETVQEPASAVKDTTMVDVSKTCRPVPVTMVLSRRGADHNEDEWMYQLSAAEAQDTFAAPNAALHALVRGDFSAAKAVAVAPAQTDTPSEQTTTTAPCHAHIQRVLAVIEGQRDHRTCVREDEGDGGTANALQKVALYARRNTNFATSPFGELCALH